MPKPVAAAEKKAVKKGKNGYVQTKDCTECNGTGTDEDGDLCSDCLCGACGQERFHCGAC